MPLPNLNPSIIPNVNIGIKERLQNYLFDLAFANLLPYRTNIRSSIDLTIINIVLTENIIIH